jgi:glutamate dehydrogenase/leucine dehydrogenase
VRVQKLESTDGFLLFDLDGAERSAGVARLAPKVLHDSAELLARTMTYTFAAFRVRAGGASAGINAKPDGRDAAVTAFLDEVKPLVASGSLTLYASTGLSDGDLADLGTDPPDPALTAHSAIAATEAALGTLEGKTVAVVGSGPVADTARVTASDKGATVADDAGVDASADALLVAGKTGVIDHDAAESVKTQLVVPLTPLPVTAKAYAAFRRADIVYVPDFIALAAPVLAALDSKGSDPVERVRSLMQQLVSEGPNAWLVAVGLAEAFLATWQDALPFGRPLA